MSEASNIQPFNKPPSLPTANATRDEVLTAIMQAKALVEAAKAVQQNVTASVIDWINANGDLVDGTKRWYVGKNRTAKCVNVPGCVEAVMNATGGDFEMFTSTLSANAFKNGACRKVLGEADYQKLFRTVEEDELSEGKAPTLKFIDTRFCPSPTDAPERGDVEVARVRPAPRRSAFAHGEQQ